MSKDEIEALKKQLAKKELECELEWFSSMYHQALLRRVSAELAAAQGRFYLSPSARGMLSPTSRLEASNSVVLEEPVHSQIYERRRTSFRMYIDPQMSPPLRTDN